MHDTSRNLPPLKPVLWAGSSKADLIDFPAMKAKIRTRNEHGVRDVTAAGRSVFQDLFSAEEAAELEIRSTLLRGLEQWLARQDMTQTQIAKTLGVTQSRVSDIKRGKINQSSLDLLVRLAARAGLHPRIRLTGRRGEETSAAATA